MTIKLSPSSISLMLECPRCFWLHFNKNIRRPAGIFPSLPAGMDKILKNHFDKFRDKGELPPEIKEDCKDCKLFDNKELLSVWQNNLKGIQWKDKDGNLIRGAVDNILVNDGRFIVLDYKTRGYELKEDTTDLYQHQLDIYNFLLRKNNYETEDYSFLLFYVPKEVTETGEIIFDTTLKKMKVDVNAAEGIINKAIEVLQGEIPQPSKDCLYCKFIKERSSQFESLQLIDVKSPFSNEIRFIRILENCGENICWLDKYISKKSLEFLSSMDNPNVKNIRLLTAVDKVDEPFRNLFKKFREEMKNKNINCELKVIIDSKIKSSIHDRFIVGDFEAYNIPSADIVVRGQLSEIKQSKNKNRLQEEFNEIWDKSMDIIQDWNKIKIEEKILNHEKI